MRVNRLASRSAATAVPDGPHVEVLDGQTAGAPARPPWNRHASVLDVVEEVCDDLNVFDSPASRDDPELVLLQEVA
jgi:hypothetical protein